MKIKLVLDINKTQQAQLNAVVTGRQGDKATVTVNVFVVDGGVPVNLTGNTIYYEGLKPNNAYVRDTSGVKIINATQGNFEYTFRPETFGVAGVGKRSYFSIEQGGTVRASTQDFGLVTLADAMTGHTMSGPYISELEELIRLAQWLVDDINSSWTSINNQLTQLQNKLNTMDVVRRSGDTMTGALDINSARFLTFKGEQGKRDWIFIRDTANEGFILVPRKADNSDWDWGVQTEFRPNNFIVNGGTNLLKKSDYTAKDGGAALTLTANVVTHDAGYAPIADRRGNVVTVRLAVKRVTGSVGKVVTTLPSTMRPTFVQLAVIPSLEGVLGLVTISGNGEVWLEDANATSMIEKRFYIDMTYVVD
ncbi:BppU family phage baseplate upper protein [Bacillus cereus]|uniref:BppU family phage baseplate upper protein n=1 Tax=Bacillus cereus TaxID=1396 RepID=UPI003CFBDDC3